MLQYVSTSILYSAVVKSLLLMTLSSKFCSISSNTILITFDFSLCWITFLHFLYCRIVGDNVDHEITARVQSKEHGNRSIHWTHQFAMLEKVNEQSQEKAEPQEKAQDLQFTNLLPDTTIQDNLICQWAILVSRVVTKYIPAFKPYQKHVIYHIPQSSLLH